MALPYECGLLNFAGPSCAYRKYSNPGRELRRKKINRGFVRTVLLHLNSARSGDTRHRQSYSSPAKLRGGEKKSWDCAPSLFWLMFCDVDSVPPLIHQDLDPAVALTTCENSHNYCVSPRRNGARRRRRCLLAARRHRLLAACQGFSFLFFLVWKIVL